MKPYFARALASVAIVLAFLGHAAGVYELGLVSRLDRILYDVRMRLTMPGGVDESIVILDIDEQSLQEVGRWPWPRDVMAELVDKLFDRYAIGIVGFDVVFAEADHSSGLRVLDRLAREDLKAAPAFQSAYAQLRPQLDNDGRFARALKDRPVVLGYYLNAGAGARRIAAIPPPVLPKGAFGERRIDFLTFDGYGGNLEIVQASATGAGHFNPDIDVDGVVRRVPIIAELDGAYYEALSLAMVRAMVGFPEVEAGIVPESALQKGYAGLEWLKAGPFVIPVDDRARVLVPYRGVQRSFRYVSLADVLADRVPPDSLKGRIALVGTTAPGLLDQRATPVENVYPGVEIHANLIAGILENRIPRMPAYMVGAEVVLLAVLGLSLAFLLPVLPAVWATVAAATGVLLATSLTLALWTQYATVLPFAAALLMIAIIYTVDMAYGYFVESRTKRAITSLFGQYVPPELVDRMAQDPGKYSMEGRSEDLTVLFSDIVGFTSISESLSPKDLSAFINVYLTSMSLAIRNHSGTLDKYIGDAIMAFWGAPVADAKHALNGVTAALAMQTELRRINVELVQPRGWPEIRIGIGLNSGIMRVGDMGSQIRRAYTVMGDPVNLGSRLEGLTRVYGVDILVGEETRARVPEIVFREIDRVRVKGKDAPVAIFEPLGPTGTIAPAQRAALECWTQCLARYRAQDWEATERLLGELERMDGARKLYAEFRARVREFRAAPPGDGWDGVIAFKSK